MKFLILGKGITGKGAKLFLDSINCKNDLFNTEEVNNYDYDYVIKSPGINPKNEVLNKLSINSKIISDIELSYMFYPEKFYIAVTGTNGKTTLCNILYTVLKDKGYKMCGNIGNSILLEKSKNLIVECSSFQLKYIDKFKPNISIILNVNEAHLDYHGSFNNYKNDKLNIIKNMNKNIIYNIDDKILKEKFNNYKNLLTFSLSDKNATCYLNKNYIYYKNKKYLKTKKLKIKNKFNIYNILASIICLKLLNIDDKIIKNKILDFKGLKYRMEKIKNNIYNDSKSTNPSSTLAAINSLDKKIFLICGGVDRNSDFTCLDNVLNKIKGVYTYGECKMKIYNYFINKNIHVETFNSLKEATNMSLKDLKKEVILFSPMSASWDMYNSYIERGIDFENIINNYYISNKNI